MSYCKNYTFKSLIRNNMNEILELTDVAGTKFLKASSPITKEWYCKIRGWKVPEDEDPIALQKIGAL